MCSPHQQIQYVFTQQRRILACHHPGYREIRGEMQISKCQNAISDVSAWQQIKTLQGTFQEDVVCYFELQ